MKDGQSIILFTVLGAFFAVSLGVPILYLFHEAFFVQGFFSLQNVRALLSDELLIESFMNSFFVAFWCALFSMALGLALANLAVRRIFPLRRLFDLLVIAPLFLPPLVGVLGIKALLGRSGSVAILISKLNLSSHPFDLLSPHSPIGVILIQTIHLYPLVYLQLVSYLSRFNSELEEAAVSVGAASWRWFTAITLPLLLPALISSGLLVFIASFTDIGTPLLFEYRNTVAVQVFNMLTDATNSGSGYVLVFFVGCLTIGLFLFARWIENGTPIVSSSRSSKPIPKARLSGLVEYSSWIFCVAVVFLSVLPQVGVALEAASERWFMSVIPQSFTLAHFVEVFIHPVAGRSLLYSVILSIISTALVTVIGFVISWRAARRGSIIDRAFESVAMLPLCIPGIVIAFGLMLGFSDTPLDNRNNPTALLIIAYTVRRLPFMVRILTAGLQQMGAQMEEAAYVCGASFAATMRRITIPEISPACIAAMILCFIGGLLEVSDSLLLAIEEKYYPIAKALYALSGRPDGTPVASALGVVVSVIVVIGFLIAGRLAGRSVTQLITQ